MSGLPPATPSHKVKVRSHTSSFKRPISCDASQIEKKESRGLFYTLRKGSSNSKINEIPDDLEEPKAPVVNEKNVVHRIEGRNFNSDEDDYDDPSEETSVTKMDKLFENIGRVVNNPALIGYMLTYLSEHNLEYNSLLYYLVVQHYKATVQLKEGKDAARYANEILTTFVLEKSILKVGCQIDVLAMLDDLKSNRNLLKIFDKSSDAIYNQNVRDIIVKVRKSITHGLFKVDPSVGSSSIDHRMLILNDSIKTVVGKLGNIPESDSDIVVAVKTCLATVYFYFNKKDKDDNADNISTISSKNVRNSFLGKSIESLQFLNNCVLEKHPIFCSKLIKKSTGSSFFRRGKSSKLHNFQESVFEYPKECIHCQRPLWGINPQGLTCSHCMEIVHRSCRDNVSPNCTKDGKKHQHDNSNFGQITTKSEPNRICYEEETASTNSDKYNNNNDYKDSKDIKVSINDHNNKFSEDLEFERSSVSIVSPDISEYGKAGSVIPNTVINIINENEVFSTTPSSDHFTNSSCVNEDQQNETIKSTSDLRANNHSEKSNVRTLASKFDKNISRSHSEDNWGRKTLTLNSKRTSEVVVIQDLVPDSSAWESDPDMHVAETFEANKELEYFTYHPKKDQNKAEYIRLLVLMEFHHKIKFTVMTLKRFDYLLIRKWPAGETQLLKTLRLDIIVPLYELIKTLEARIELCKDNISYSKDVAKNVHDWLVTDGESNLQQWLNYSIDLCCTNSLSLVKNAWFESYRNDPKLFEVLNKRHNKMVMVEQLSNMRPLLFNLPLIVNKIMKDLTKFSVFKEEALIWAKIYEKFKRLPTFIDEHCMPLVQLINNGTIVNNLDRGSWSSRLSPSDPFYDFILDFPKTAFHYKLFDFQEIKITNLKESYNKDKVPGVFIKESIDAYAICYDDMLVLLQKESEKYHLKQFKATDNSKMSPILMLENVHATKSQQGYFSMLTLIFLNVYVLAQIQFAKTDVSTKWCDFISKMMKRKVLVPKPEIKVEIETESEIGPSREIVPSNDDIDIYSEIKSKFQEFSLQHSLLFEDDIKLATVSDQNVVFPITNDSKELIIGTSFDAINLLKICYDNLSVPLNDAVLENFLAMLSIMENRISSFRNLMSKDILTTDDIECDISEMQGDEAVDKSPQYSPSNSPSSALSANSERTFDFQTLPNVPQSDSNIEITDNEDLEKDISFPVIDESRVDEDILSLVKLYVSEILEEALKKVERDCSTDKDSDLSVNEPPSVDGEEPSA